MSDLLQVNNQIWRQAPIIGVLLAMVFGGQKDAIPYWCLGALQELARKSGGVGDGLTQTLNGMQSTPDHSGSIFFVVVAAVWFGTSNAAREIVSAELREPLLMIDAKNGARALVINAMGNDAG